MPVTSRSLLCWTLFGTAIALFAAVGVTLLLLRPGHLKATAERTLSERLGLDVTMADLSVSIWPRPRVTATQMVFRVPSRPDLPPYAVIDRAWADLGPFSVWRGHVKELHAEGLRITVPPRSSDATATEGTPVTQAEPRRASTDVIVDKFETRDAVLTLQRRDPDREPLEFKIHSLRLNGVGFGRKMTFSTTLTNPVPEGLVNSEGWIGPWNRDRPTDVALGGTYTFSLANLGTIRGIGGTLTSTGSYEGQVTEIVVSGETHTPDFSLDAGGKPLPLTARFTATIDGSNGSTALERVDATLLQTAITVRGRIDNLPGPGRRHIELTADVTDGRIEDLLALAVAAPRPLLVGDVTLKSRISLPPGKGSVRERLVLDGTFGLDQSRFTGAAVQAKLTELSQRSQGKDQDERAARVLTSLSGKFRMASSVLHLRGVTFQVPGAVVNVDGAYDLVTSELDFLGTLRMDASVSKAVGGMKSIFLRPFDWMFRRGQAASVIPITITGSVKQPDIGISIRRVLTRGKRP